MEILSLIDTPNVERRKELLSTINADILLPSDREYLYDLAVKYDDISIPHSFPLKEDGWRLEMKYLNEGVKQKKVEITKTVACNAASLNIKLVTVMLQYHYNDVAKLVLNKRRSEVGWLKEVSRIALKCGNKTMYAYIEDVLEMTNNIGFR